MTRDIQLLGWALYLSESWYALWTSRNLLRPAARGTLPLYSKTRAMVLYDRVLTGRY